MTNVELLNREDQLASWRLTALLAFNALLLPALKVNNQHVLHYDIIIIPIIGFLITLSIMGVMCMGLVKKYELHNSWFDKDGEYSSPMGSKCSKSWFYAKHFFGPFLFCPAVLLIFWLYVGLRVSL